MREPGEVLQVTAAVLRRAGRVLIARRVGPPELAGMWELPGGKVEPGESPEACLERELAEELGIETRVGALVASHRHAYADRTIELSAYEVELIAGEPRPREHSELRWVAPDELACYELVPADVPLLRALAEAPDSGR